MNEMMLEVAVGPELERIAEVAHRAGLGLMLLGPTGSGKTTVLKSLAHRLGIGYRRLDLGVMDVVDLGGFPVPSNGRMTTLLPPWWPGADEPTGILVLEELTRVSSSLRNGVLNLVSEHALNGHTLPPGWSVFATANPADETYSDAQDIDPALRARFIEIKVRADVNGWCAWASAHGHRREVIDFVRLTPFIFSSTRSNPRAWTYVSNLLHANETAPLDQQVNDSLLFKMVAGLVDEALAASFIRFWRNAPLPLPTSKVLVAEYKQSYRRLVRDLNRVGDSASLTTLTNQLTVFLNIPDVARSTAEDSVVMANLAALLNDLPADLAKHVKEQCCWLKEVL